MPTKKNAVIRYRYIDELLSNRNKRYSTVEIADIVNCQFSFDNFKWQKETGTKIAEPFRADYLNRVLYKCPVCGADGEMKGEGVHLTCKKCGKQYTLDEYGYIRSDGECRFDHIPDWYQWQREEVRAEIERGEYRLDLPVDILVTVDTYGLYHVGEGRLIHTAEGFSLEGCDGALSYHQKPLASYTLNADFYWYEGTDIISFGNTEMLYYCFPKEEPKAL